MKLSTALIAVATSVLGGALFALLVPIAPAIIYVFTGVNVNLD